MKMQFGLILSIAIGFTGCGRHSSSLPPMPFSKTTPTQAEPRETFLSIEDGFRFMMGNWNLEGAPKSWQDLGSDILRFEIKSTGFSYEKMGHVAQQTIFFNTHGHNYGGDCHFKVTGKEYGLKRMDNGTLRFAVYPDVITLLEDPGNSPDCAEQITRLNHVRSNDLTADFLGTVTLGSDDNRLIYTPNFTLGNPKPRTYVRAPN
jgi:hypothetical protein